MTDSIRAADELANAERQRDVWKRRAETAEAFARAVLALKGVALEGDIRALAAAHGITEETPVRIETRPLNSADGPLVVYLSPDTEETP